MPDLSDQQPVVAPRSILFLPVAYMVHLAEEWFGGLLAWTPGTLGYEISVERFLVINGVAVFVFVLGTIAALLNRRVAWLGASFAALLGLNGALHTLATIGFARYAPGVVTGLLLYVPLAVIVLRSYTKQMDRASLGRAIAVGVGLHAMVAVLAAM